MRYIEADPFHWQPTEQLDAVFFAFWLSHVPPDRFDMVIATCLWRDPVPDLGDRAVYHAVGEGNDDGLVLDRGFKAGRVTAGHFIS